MLVPAVFWSAEATDDKKRCQPWNVNGSRVFRVIEKALKWSLFWANFERLKNRKYKSYNTLISMDWKLNYYRFLLCRKLKSKIYWRARSKPHQGGLWLAKERIKGDVKMIHLSAVRCDLSFFLTDSQTKVINTSGYKFGNWHFFNISRYCSFIILQF